MVPFYPACRITYSLGIWWWEGSSSWGALGPTLDQVPNPNVQGWARVALSPRAPQGLIPLCGEEVVPGCQGPIPMAGESAQPLGYNPGHAGGSG